MAWSPQQREWLQALGHDVVVLAATGDPSESAAATDAAATTEAALASAPPPSPSASRQALQQSLMRAAGRRDLAALEWLPDLGTLRGNAAAKRALWPRLRALRKARGDA